MSIKFGSLEVADIKFGSIDVNYVYSGSNLVWQRSTPPTEDLFYLTSDVNFYAMYTLSRTTLTVSIDYRIGETGSWTSWDGTQVSVSGGTKLYVRNNNTTLSTSAGIFQFSGNFKTVGGNLKYMLGESDTLSDSCFGNLFRAITSLQNASELILPWMTLAERCYNTMFSDCTSLETCPALPATTLAAYCYYGMFYSCRSLTQLSALPATTLQDNCYTSMFENCTSLTQLPALPATTLAYSCYYNMFRGCSNIKLSTTQTGEYVNAYRIPTTGEGTTATYALNSMFANTGGTFTGTPSINTTYYTSNEIIS